MQTIPSDSTKFFNSMPDLFTYVEQHDEQRDDIDVHENVYLTNNEISNLNLNRSSMLSNSSAMSDYSNDPSVVLEVVNIT